MSNDDKVRILLSGDIDDELLRGSFKLICVTDILTSLRVLMMMFRRSRKNIELDLVGDVEYFARNIGTANLLFQEANKEINKPEYKIRSADEIKAAHYIFLLYDGMVEIYSRQGWQERLRVWTWCQATREMFFLLGSILALLVSALSHVVKEETLRGYLSFMPLWQSSLLLSLAWVGLVLYIIITAYHNDIRGSRFIGRMIQTFAQIAVLSAEKSQDEYEIYLDNEVQEGERNNGSDVGRGSAVCP